MIVVHEVFPSTFSRDSWIPAGSLFEWIRKERAISDVGLRQFGFMNSNELRKAKVWLPEISPTLESDVFSFALVMRGSFSLYCRLFDTDIMSPFQLDTTRRPGVDANKKLADSIGLSFSDDMNIYSVAVSETNAFLQDIKAQDGWLVRSSSEKSIGANSSEMLFLALGVSIERALINQASKALSRGRGVPLNWRRHLTLLRAWPTLPAIDSTFLAKEYLDLRGSLNLEHRRVDVLKALELKERNFGLQLSAFAAALALIALGSDMLARLGL